MWPFLFFIVSLIFFHFILLIMLLLLSWFFPLCSPSTQHPPLPQAIPHNFSCPWVMCISFLATPIPILYFTSPWLFCNYLFVLCNPLTSSCIPQTPIPSGSHQMHPWFCLCSSCLLSLFVFSDSIVDTYVFIAILLFIVLISFFLNKFLLHFIY